MSIVERIRDRMARSVSGPLEQLFRAVERSQMSRGAVLESIPAPKHRGGGLGTTTYGEWCYTVGLFQTLIFQNLPTRPVRMLDVGCGVGRMYLAAKSYLTETDSYLGIDVGKSFIDICQNEYREPNVSFLYTEAANRYYAKQVDGDSRAWPMEDSSHNLITALSVWTHLDERDWRFYLKEVSRVLAPGGRAIISFFILDDLYDAALPKKTGQISRYYPQPENKWIFDAPAYDSEHWKYPSWAAVPEVAIGVSQSAFDEAVAAAGLKVKHYYPGQWKDQPGFFFQDVVVFEPL
jgi:SAM-dependent methyltransferase